MKHVEPPRPEPANRSRTGEGRGQSRARLVTLVGAALTFVAVALFLAFAPVTYRAQARITLEPLPGKSPAIPAPLDSAERLKQAAFDDSVVNELAGVLGMSGRPPAEVRAHLESMLDVQGPGHGVFDFIVIDARADRARTVCNTLARRAAGRANAILLSGQVDAEASRKADVQRRRDELAAFVAAHPELQAPVIAPVASAPGPTRTEPQLSALRAERDQLEAKIAQAQAADSDNPYAEASADTLQFQRRLKEIDSLLNPRRPPAPKPSAQAKIDPAVEREWRRLLAAVTEPAPAPAVERAFTVRLAEALLPASPVETRSRLLVLLAVTVALAGVLVLVQRRSRGTREAASAASPRPPDTERVDPRALGAEQSASADPYNLREHPHASHAGPGAGGSEPPAVAPGPFFTNPALGSEPPRPNSEPPGEGSEPPRAGNAQPAGEARAASSNPPPRSSSPPRSTSSAPPRPSSSNPPRPNSSNPPRAAALADTQVQAAPVPAAGDAHPDPLRPLPQVTIALQPGTPAAEREALPGSRRVSSAPPPAAQAGAARQNARLSTSTLAGFAPMPIIPAPIRTPYPPAPDLTPPPVVATIEPVRDPALKDAPIPTTEVLVGTSTVPPPPPEIPLDVSVPRHNLRGTPSAGQGRPGERPGAERRTTAILASPTPPNAQPPPGEERARRMRPGRITQTLGSPIAPEVKPKPTYPPSEPPVPHKPTPTGYSFVSSPPRGTPAVTPTSTPPYYTVPSAKYPSTPRPGVPEPRRPRAEPANVKVHAVHSGWSPDPRVEFQSRRQLADELFPLAVDGCFVVGVSAVPEARQHKTRVASELALALAEARHPRVLLVEGDFQWPAVHEVMHIEMPFSAGFSQQLRARAQGRLTSWTVVQCGPALHVIAEGVMRSPGLILSSHFEESLRSFRTRYDIVVVDGPLASLEVDSRAFDSVVDGLVLVSPVAGSSWLSTASSLFSEKRFSKVVTI